MPRQAGKADGASAAGSWGIVAGNRGGPTGGAVAPLEGGPGGPPSTNPGGKPVRLNVPDDSASEEALEPALDTPAQLPHQQKQLRRVHFPS